MRRWAGGGDRAGAAGVPGRAALPDRAAPLPRSRAEDKQWFEAWEDDTVGTFSNMGFEDDKTGESCPVGGREGFSCDPCDLGRTEPPF